MHMGWREYMYISKDMHILKCFGGVRRELVWREELALETTRRAYFHGYLVFMSFFSVLLIHT